MGSVMDVGDRGVIDVKWDFPAHREKLSVMSRDTVRSR